MTIRYMRGGNTAVYSPGNYRASANGCFRNIVARDYYGQPTANTRERFTFDIGTLCEKILADKWTKEGRDVKLDVEVTEKITEDVHIMGHIDAILDGVVHEEKSVQSVNSFKKIIKGGLYKVENVMQLVQYLLISEQTEGILLYTIVGYFGDKSEPGQQREFKVKIRDDGSILVNNQEETSFTIFDILRHRDEAARLLKDKIISTEIPTTLDPPWEPCGSCWLSPYCEIWNKNQDDNEFWKNVSNHLDKYGKR